MLIILSQMKVPVLHCLAFSLAIALAENRPTENSDKSDDARDDDEDYVSIARKHIENLERALQSDVEMRAEADNPAAG
jgi:hypothetical protein